MFRRSSALAVVTATATALTSFVAAAAPATAAPVAAPPAAAPAEDSPAIRLQADTFRPQAGERPDIPPGLTRAAYARGERGYWLVQLDTGPVEDTDVAAIEAAGAEVLGYVPDMAFKVAMTPEQAEQVESLPEVGWVGLFHPAYRLSPARGGQPDMFRVVVEQDADPAGTTADLERAGARIDHRQGRVLRVVANAQALERSAHVEGVAWIEPFVMPEAHNEFGGGAIMGATTAHTDGYDGSGQVVAVADSGLGDGTTTGAHADIPASRVTAVHDWPAANSSGCYDAYPDGAQDVDSGHGTHTAASVVSDGDSSGLGTGTAPGASLVFQAVEDYADMKGPCTSYGDGYHFLGLPNDLTPLFQQAFEDGARVHSNSWGSDVAGAYTVDAATTDDYVWDHPTMAVTFSAGNAGIDANGDGVVDQDSIGSPGTAKNVITVGASENDRGGDWSCDTITPECASQLGQNSIFTYGDAWPDDYPAAPLSTDPSAGDAQQMAAFSSRGPTDDGRIKPDVVAPGTWVLSGYSDLYQEFYDGGSPNPQNGAWQYDGYGYPASEAYKYMSGTSMSNPLVAGGAAVLREFYATEHGLDASAALVKATMVNSAVDLLDENNDGVDDNDYPIPNSHEGWGRVDLAAATDGSHSHVEGTAGLSTAGTSTHTVQVAPGQPFKATLVWSDAPATAGTATTLVNDLDLVVTSPSDTVYRGNVFTAGWSQPGGTADTVNNVENVFLPSEGLEAGEWSVEVVGTNVPVGPQPFALVVDHATPSECLDDLREEDDTPATATDDLTSNFTVTDGALCDAADYFLVNTAGDEVINASLTPAAGGDDLQVGISEVDGATETVLANEAAPAGTTSTAVHQVAAGGTYYVRVTGADASAQNAYALDVDVTLAPPDRTIAFSTDTDGDNEVAVVDESGTSPLVLTDNTAYDGHPFWSPDRSRIAFTSDRDGDRDIWVMDADGGNPQQLTGVGNPSDDGVDEKPAWSPDGTEIAFLSDREGPRRVFVMNADGTSQGPLTLPFRDDAGARDDDPAWSPDGRQVVMSSMPGGGTDADLWLVDRDGSGVVQLTSGPDLDTEPDWSHDGSSIVFRRDDGDGIGELWAVTPNGAHEDLMLTGTPDKAAPSWSPAGDRVVHVNRGPGGAGDAELEIVVADGGATSDLVPGTAHDADPDWGTDGTVGGPVNDNLADALRIEGPEVVDGHRTFDTTDATTESGETAPQGTLGNSVWWEYTGPSWASRAFFHAEFDTPGDVVLAVYRDTNGGEAFLGDLELVSSKVYVPSSAWETMDVPLEPDETVYLQLYGDGATAGPGSLDWWSFAVNDRFADAIALEPAAGGTTTGNNEFASTETDEPDVGGTLAQSTVWWTWTAPADGEVVFDTDGSEVDTLLDVFSGTDLATLSHEGRADPDAPISVPVIANDQFHVRIDTPAEPGNLTLNWCMDDIHEPNDAFGTAEPLTSGEPINAVACDDDFYSIDAAAGETVAATLTWDSQGGTVPMTIQLLDADGATVLDEVVDSTIGAALVSYTSGGQPTVVRIHGSHGGSPLDYGLAVELHRGVRADFNGDGFVDLAVGVPGETVSGQSGAGAVQVIYGTSSGLRPAGDQLWHQDVVHVDGVAESGDGFGSALVAEDLDGDGFVDLAVGVPGETVSGQSGAGAVQVIYGTSSGLRPAGDQLWHQDVVHVDGVAESGDGFGSALVAEDLDGDGFVDLAVGVPGETVSGQSGAGAVQVIYGTSSGLRPAGDQLWHQDVVHVDGVAESGDGFGSALVAEDLDGDGFVDLAVGVPGETVSGQSGAGAVQVIYGTSSGLRPAGDQLWHQDVVHVDGVAESGDGFGSALVAEDLDGDGFVDLAVGVPGETVSGQSGAGAVQVIYGTSSGLRPAGDQLWHQDVVHVDGVAESGDGFGSALVAEDLDGDGFVDLAVGVPGETVSGQSGAGAVQVIYGTSSGLRPAGDQLWHQDVVHVDGVAESGDGFGSALVAEDLDGDGFVDLAVGVPGETVSGQSGAGAVQVIYGTSSGLRPAGDQLWHQDVVHVDGVAESGDGFGSALR